MTESGQTGKVDYDVIVVGAGIGGLYGVYRFRAAGLDVLGIEGGGGVGGVWYHNRYPGARVDFDSIDYCYYFSDEITREWEWSERYASQPELLEYLNFVADRFDLKPHFRFNSWVIGGEWNPDSLRWVVTTSAGEVFRCRYLVMATGNLSHARRPPFVGLDRFEGEWVQTSHWPEREVALDGRRIGIIGTGSSGVQAIPMLAQHAEHLTVFQRTANYVAPAVNRRSTVEDQSWVRERRAEEREVLFHAPSGSRIPVGTRPAAELSGEEQREILERQWAFGGQGLIAAFPDQGTNIAANDVVADFVREKIRGVVRDPRTAEKLMPRAYPIGTRRLALGTNYYETFNRDNVSLVDIREDPIVEITETGLRTAAGAHELDLLVFALGFHPFMAAVDAANLRNEHGLAPSDGWVRGPRTLLGLMTPGFPNLFFPTGAGGPSVLANLFLNNEFSMDWIADAISYMESCGYVTMEPSDDAVDEWQAHVAETAAPLLRLRVDNYMVQVLDDGTRVFFPYPAGFGEFVERAREVARQDYRGFIMRTESGEARGLAQANR